MGIQMLKLHWKASKWVLLPFLIAAFGLPLYGGRAAWGAGDVDLLMRSWQVLESAAVTSLIYAPLAALLGATVALTAWNWDHQKGHVYPLSLPIDRWRYSTAKFSTGLILLAIPTGMMAFGGMVTAQLIDLPTGLNVYPFSIAFQFYLASATAYSIFFALAAGTIKTTVLVISTLAAVVFFGDGVMDFVGNFVEGADDVRVAGSLFKAVVSGFGPLRVFAGNWMLIDV